MAIQEKDIVLRSLDKNGNTIIGKPITRLANIEADAETKENPADNDYIPIIDTNDNEQMKKAKVSNIKSVGATALPKANGTATVGTSVKYAREDHVHPGQTSVSGNAGTATKFAAERTIDGVSFDGSSNIAHYGICSTAAATAAKTVVLMGFVLDTGAEVTVKFTVTNTAANPTLNVNNTGAKAIYYRGAAIAAGYLAANRTYSFRYNGTQYDLVGDIDTNTTYTVATTAKNGLMSAADKTKLDGVETGANAYTHPDTSGNKHIPAGGSSGQILRWSADGTAVWGADNNTTYSAMTGASASAAGKAGLVPAPTAGSSQRFLNSAGIWKSAFLPELLPTGTDLNSCNIPGVYYCLSTNTFNNLPSGSRNGWLYVTHNTNVNYAKQIYIDSASTRVYIRFSSPINWSIWREFVILPSDTDSQSKYLRGDGTWQTPPDTNTTYSEATQSAVGLMSAADKKKLDSLTELVTVSDYNNVTITEIIYNDSIIRLKIVVSKDITIKAAKVLNIGELTLFRKETLAQLYGHMGSPNAEVIYQKKDEGAICLISNVGTEDLTISLGTYYI